MCLDRDYEQVIRDTPPGQPVMMTLDDLDDFGGYIAAEANHCGEKRKQKRLDAIFEKNPGLARQVYGRGTTPDSQDRGGENGQADFRSSWADCRMGGAGTRGGRAVSEQAEAARRFLAGSRSARSPAKGSRPLENDPAQAGEGKFVLHGS